jgi:hypothetical protein
MRLRLLTNMPLTQVTGNIRKTQGEEVIRLLAEIDKYLKENNSILKENNDTLKADRHTILALPEDVRKIMRHTQ